MILKLKKFNRTLVIRTKHKEGSQSLENTRKFKILDFLVIPETINPAPKMIPTPNPTKISEILLVYLLIR